MNIARLIKFARIALVSLKENKKQAVLTMLGIVIGIAAVIAILSLGKGAEKLILSSVESFGNRSIFVQPGGGTRGGPPSVTALDKVKFKDYLALLKLEYLEDVTPILVKQGTVAFGNVVQKTPIVGSNENYSTALRINMLDGRDLESFDINNSAKVVVLGLKMARELFGEQDPIGERVKVNNINFTVIGVYDKQGQRFFQDFDKRIVIPISVMRNEIMGVDYVTSILANVKSDYTIEEVVDDLRFFIRKRHALFNPDNDPNKDDFRVVSQVDSAKTFQGISDAISIFLVMVAAISLLVGGIGIMNIMFVSVSERTREIGLRKAVGATGGDILLQFLIEAVVITFTAGLIGVVLGIGFSYLASLIIVQFSEQWQFIVTIDSVVVAFVVSVLIGLTFGLYPARKAARLSPIEALRQE